MAVFDVGSGSVAGAVIELRGEKPVLIHTSFRSHIPYEERSNEQLASAIVQKVEEVGRRLLDNHAKGGVSRKGIHECLTVVHVPWIDSITHNLEAPLKEESEILEEMILQLSQKAFAQSNEGNSKEVFEKSIVRVELNGYPTSAPLKKIAKQIGVVVLETQIFGNMKKQITDRIVNMLPGVQPVFRSSTLIDSTLMRRRAPESAHFTIADITSEATSITVIRRGAISEQKTVPIGYRSITRAVSKERGSSVDDIQSRIRMLMKGECSTDECRSLEASMDAVGSQFTQEFGNIFSEISKSKKLPNTLVMHCHPDLSNWFTKFFTRLDFAQFTETTRPFLVGEISLKSIAEYVIFMPGNALDSGIATSCAFLYTGKDDKVGNLET